MIKSTYVKSHKLKVWVDVVLQEDESVGFFYSLFVEGVCLNVDNPINIYTLDKSEALSLCPSGPWIKEFYGQVIDDFVTSKT